MRVVAEPRVVSPSTPGADWPAPALGPGRPRRSIRRLPAALRSGAGRPGAETFHDPRNTLLALRPVNRRRLRLLFGLCGLDALLQNGAVRRQPRGRLVPGVVLVDVRGSLGVGVIEQLLAAQLEQRGLADVLQVLALRDSSDVARTLEPSRSHKVGCRTPFRPYSLTPGQRLEVEVEVVQSDGSGAPSTASISAS